MLQKFLVTDGVHPLLLEGLEGLGFQVEYLPKISLEKVKSIIFDYDGMIINSKILVDRALIDAAPKLKYLGRLGSGMEIIDMDYAAKAGIYVMNAPDGNCDAVGEHAIGMLLTLSNKLLSADRNVRAKHWDREGHRGFEIANLTLGIIGFGHTGFSLAKKISGFGVQVLAYDKYKKGYADDFDHVKESNMNEIFEKADMVSFHLPLTDKTAGLVDQKYLQSFKKNIIVINTSRGIVIKTQDLIEQLENGKVRGACLDVFENEKPNTYSKSESIMYDKLYDFDNVVLSPHVAGWTVESKERLASILLKKITKAINNKG